MKKKSLLIILFFSVIFSVYSQDTVQVVTYNLLRFNSSTDRNLDFENIMNYISPDVLIVQEMVNNEGFLNFQNNILKNIDDKYLSADFIDDENTDIDQALFYNQNKFEFISTSKLDGDPRPIYIFELRHKETEVNFLVFNLHLKASKGSDNEARRRDQVVDLKNYLSEMDDYFYVVAGDLNIYSTNEDAYNQLFSITESGKGNLHDLVSLSGTYNNPDYSIIHTQSTRTTQFGGGSHGGLDDRFDFILFSDSLMFSDRVFVIDSSYKTIGNDGKHYNLAINEQPNLSVPSDISNSLHNASDHLPVSVNIIFSKEKIYRDVLNFETNKLNETILIYPNPSKTKININSKFLLINSIQIYDNFGRIILSNKINSNRTEIDISNLLLGNYWIRINFNFGSKNFKIIKN